MAGGPGPGRPPAQPRDLLRPVPPPLAAASRPYPRRVPGRSAQAAWLPCPQGPGAGASRLLATLLIPCPGQPVFLLVFCPTCRSQAGPAPSGFHGDILSPSRCRGLSRFLPHLPAFESMCPLAKNTATLPASHKFRRAPLQHLPGTPP